MTPESIAADTAMKVRGNGFFVKLNANPCDCSPLIVLEPVATSMIERLYGKFAGSACLDDLEAKHQQEIQRDLCP